MTVADRTSRHDVRTRLTASVLGATGWLALLIAGQIAMLRLTAAGPVVRYQHVQLTRDRLALAILLAQGAIVVLLLAPTVASQIARWSRRTWLKAAFVLVTCAAIACAPSWRPQTLAVELLAVVVMQAIAAGTVWLTLRALPDINLPTRVNVTMLSLLAAAVCAALALLAYQAHPHVPDEVGYVMQARYFSDLRLAMPPPPVPTGFELDLFAYEPTRWYSVFPPGWPAVLAIGTKLGVSWLVNPLLTGAAILLASRLYDALYGPRTSRLATLLLAGSPWLLFMGMSYMSHTLSLVASLAAALGIVNMRRSGHLAWGLAAGAAIGLVSIMRPLEGVAVAALFGILSLGKYAGQWRLAPAASVVAGTLLAGSLGLWYNWLLAGNPMVFPVEEWFKHTYGVGRYEIGFGPTRGLGWPGLDPLPGHGPLDVLVNAQLNTFAIGTELFGWATGSLLPLIALVSAGHLHKSDRLMLFAVFVIAAAHSFFWFAGGPDFGARYWFLMIVPLVALSARGVEQIGEWIGERRAVTAALLLTVTSLATFVPWRATDKYYHYRGMRPDVRELARRPDFANALVLIRGRGHPDYASAAVYNPVDVRDAGPIFAWDRNQSVREALLAAYPDRPVWVVDGPSLTGNGYVVSAGPLSGPARQQLEHAR
jgi:hypothetical protein